MTLQPGGICSKLGGIYSDVGAILPSCGSLVVPNKWWCPPNAAPAAAWCGVDGISSAVCRRLLGANVPAVWLFGCVAAGSGASGSHPPYTNSGESPPMGNNKVRLCAQGSTTPGTPPRRPLCSTAVGLFRGPWAHTARRKADTRADSPCWGLCGFHLSKTFPWNRLVVPLLLQGTATLPGAEHRAMSCQGGSAFLLGSQTLAAHRAKAELSSARYLEAPPDEFSDGSRSVSLI